MQHDAGYPGAETGDRRSSGSGHQAPAPVVAVEPIAEVPSAIAKLDANAANVLAVSLGDGECPAPGGLFEPVERVLQVIWRWHG